MMLAIKLYGKARGKKEEEVEENVKEEDLAS